MHASSCHATQLEWTHACSGADAGAQLGELVQVDADVAHVGQKAAVAHAVPEWWGLGVEVVKGGLCWRLIWLHGWELSEG